MDEQIQLNQTEAKAKSLKRRKIATYAGITAAVAITAVVAIANIGKNNEDFTDNNETPKYSYTFETEKNDEPVETAQSVDEADLSDYSNVKISADGKVFTLKATGTVADAIGAAGLTLGDEDVVNLDLGAELGDGTEIVINRVEYYKTAEIRKLDYATEYKEDNSLEKGTEKTETEGVEGERVIVSLTKVVDGKVVSKNVVDDKITEEPVSKIVAQGTYEYDEEPVQTYEEDEEDYQDEEYYPEENDVEDEEEDYEEPKAVKHTDGETRICDVDQISMLSCPEEYTLDENGIPTSYSQVITGKATAYTAREGALTASGRAVEQGYIAVNPNVIPYGTELYIVGDDGEVYGYAIAADTGGFAKKGTILADLFYWSYDDCIQWGVRGISIYVLN